MDEELIWNTFNLDHYDAGRIAEPDWEEFDCDFVHVHDWRGYIPREVRSVWQQLSSDARILAYVMATEQADNEEWD